MPTLLALEAGDVLGGRYRLLSRLGIGGMSVVWRAFDETSRQEVALKLLPPELAEDPDARTRLLRESQRLARVDHPSIAKVLEAGEDLESPIGPTVFLALELLGGPSLKALLAARGHLSLAETIHLLRPVAAALDFAHEQGVVHRDVKPGNVVLTAPFEQGGQAKVIDFGIAMEVQNTLTRTGITLKPLEPGASMGTPPYMSPEQIQGKKPKPGMDLWALAVMAYEMLEGRLPFPGPNTQFQILESEPEPCEPPDAPPEVRSVVAKVLAACLAKDPSARPTRVLQLVEGLESAAKGVTPVWAGGSRPGPEILDSKGPDDQARRDDTRRRQAEERDPGKDDTVRPEPEREPEPPPPPPPSPWRRRGAIAFLAFGIVCWQLEEHGLLPSDDEPFFPPPPSPTWTGFPPVDPKGTSLEHGPTGPSGYFPVATPVPPDPDDRLHTAATRRFSGNHVFVLPTLPPEPTPEPPRPTTAPKGPFGGGGFLPPAPVGPIRIETRPSGAKVYLASGSLWPERTPCEIPRSSLAGSAELSLVLHGYRKQKIQVPPVNEDEPLTLLVTLESEPPPTRSVSTDDDPPPEGKGGIRRIPLTPPPDPSPPSRPGWRDLARRGDIPQAIELLEMELDDSDDPALALEIAPLLVKVGRSEEARIYLTETVTSAEDPAVQQRAVELFRRIFPKESPPAYGDDAGPGYDVRTRTTWGERPDLGESGATGSYRPLHHPDQTRGSPGEPPSPPKVAGVAPIPPPAASACTLSIRRLEIYKVIQVQLVLADGRSQAGSFQSEVGLDRSYRFELPSGLDLTGARLVHRWQHKVFGVTVDQVWGWSGACGAQLSGGALGFFAQAMDGTVVSQNPCWAPMGQVPAGR